jgi:hypothetical protein
MGLCKETAVTTDISVSLKPPLDVMVVPAEGKTDGVPASCGDHGVDRVHRASRRGLLRSCVRSFILYINHTHIVFLFDFLWSHYPFANPKTATW